MLKRFWLAFLTKLLWVIKPVIAWVGRVHVPDMIKPIDGETYYRWVQGLEPGMVFLTETNGEGSDLVDPGYYKHGAIFFGTGLKSVLNALTSNQSGAPLTPDQERLKVVNDSQVSNDSIPYVIEALGTGVRATDLITFLMRKDRAIVLEPHDHSLMAPAAHNAVLDLGLPYNFEFTVGDQARYCFELVALSYLKVKPSLDISEVSTLDFRTYRATSFLNSPDFDVVFNSSGPKGPGTRWLSQSQGCAC
jgi:hypothetical protein